MDDNQKDTDISEIYFVTMENLDHYIEDDTLPQSDETIIERAQLDLRLARKEDIASKKRMLYNNVFISLKKIDANKDNFPYTLYLTASYERFTLDLHYNEKELVESDITKLDDFYNQLSKENKDKCIPLYCLSLIQYTDYLMNNNDIENAVDVATKIITIGKGFDDDNTLLARCKAYSTIGSLMFSIQNFDQAKAYMGEALQCILKTSDQCTRKTNLTATLAFNIGNVYFQSNELDYAEKCFQRAINICRYEDFEDKFEIWQYASNYYAQLLVSRNQYTEAIDEYQKFIDETSQYDDDYAINIKSEFLYRIALINYKFLHNSDTALIYLNKAKDETAKAKDENSISGIKSTIQEFIDDLTK